MQTDPKQFFKQTGIYVIIEKNLDITVSGYVRVIGVATSYDDAMKYSGPNRIIEGPVPFLGKTDFEQQLMKVSYPMFKKEFEPVFTPPNLIDKNPFEQTKPIDINPFKIYKHQTDFSMLTPPSSRVGSNASSPADKYF